MSLKMQQKITIIREQHLIWGDRLNFSTAG